jgi:hypothetical protein
MQLAQKAKMLSICSSPIALHILQILQKSPLSHIELVDEIVKKYPSHDTVTSLQAIRRCINDLLYFLLFVKRATMIIPRIQYIHILTYLLNSCYI